MRLFRMMCGVGGSVAATACAAMAIPTPPAAYKVPAEFTVTTTVAAPNPGGWTCTMAGAPVENLLMGGEYEGFNFRDRYFAAEAADNAVPLSRSDATAWDSRREGFFDGATARVFRIMGGRFVNVRTSAIVRHRASGWGVTMDDKLVPADSCRFEWNFEGYNSPSDPYYFAVVAVATDGTWSLPSQAVEVWRPAKCEGKASRTGLKPYAWPRRGPGSVHGTVPAAPSGLRFTTAPDGVVTFTWSGSPTADLAGYLVLMSDYPPGKQAGYGLDLEGSAKDDVQKVHQGDMVFVDLRRAEFARRKYTANRVWGDWANGGLPEVYPGHPGESTNHTWSLVPHPEPIPAAFRDTDRGRSCLRIDMKGGEPVSLRQYNHAGPRQNWYPVLTTGRTYVVEFWAREEGMASPVVHFGFTSIYSHLIQHDFPINGEWRKFTFEFAPDKAWPPECEVVGQMVLAFSGPGTLWLDCWRVYPKDVGYMQFRPEDVAALRASGMAFVRTHMFIKSGGGSFLDDMTSAPGVVACRGNVPGGAYESTLAQMLGFMKAGGANPWLQMEMYLTEDEWKGLVEYLAAPYDPSRDTPQSKPWAYKRFALGQGRPWVDEFRKILFEISNETWNPLFHPWNFPWIKMTDVTTGRDYASGELTGLMTAYALEQMKKSPYWPGLAPKLEPVVGGWLCELGDHGFGQAACQVCPEIKHDLVANYNGGWDEGAAPAQADDAGRRLALTVVPHSIHQMNNTLAQTRDRLAAQGTRFQVGTYEAGPGYAMPNTISHAQEESEAQVMKSLAAGTGTLDCFLDGAQQGFVIQNFFTFSRNRNYWSSHAEMRRGGQAYPSWMGLSLYNNQGQGDFLVVQPRSVPVDQLDKTKTRPQVPAAPMVAVYATRQGDRYAVFVLSRKLDRFPFPEDDGFTPVTLNLPFKSARRITRYKMAGDPRATNLDAENVRIESTDIPVRGFSRSFALDAARGADDRGLPPAATYLYVFEGTSTPSLAGRSRASLTPALGQAIETHYPVVRFMALFDRAMSGLTADQVRVTGSAGGVVKVEKDLSLGGTGYLLTVSDLEHSGSVSLRIPEGAITDTQGGANATLDSTVVNYTTRPPQDTVFVSESFDLEGGRTLYTQGREPGWKAAWFLHNLDPEKRPAGFAVTTESPLAYPGLAATPAYLKGGCDYLGLWRWLDVDQALDYSRLITQDKLPAQVGLSGTTLWFSFLVRKDKVDNREIGVSLLAENFWQEQFAAVRFGYFGTGPRTATNTWGMSVRNAENKGWIECPTAVPIEVGKPVLMVARFTFGKRDSVALYVDPPLTGIEPAVPSAAYAGEAGRKLNFRNVCLWGGPPGSSSFDEIRFGDSFKAVTPR